MYGEPYWDEDTVYAFTLEEIETRIEDPSTELHAMCREAAARIVESEELLAKLDIPQAHWDSCARAGVPVRANSTGASTSSTTARVPPR